MICVHVRGARAGLGTKSPDKGPVWWDRAALSSRDEVVRSLTSCRLQGVQQRDARVEARVRFVSASRHECVPQVLPRLTSCEFRHHECPIAFRLRFDGDRSRQPCGRLPSLWSLGGFRQDVGNTDGGSAAVDAPISSRTNGGGEYL